MKMTTNRLTAKLVQSAKPKEVNGVLKDNYVPDGGGLYLIVTAKGGKLWRYHFSFQNKKYRLPFRRGEQLIQPTDCLTFVVKFGVMLYSLIRSNIT